MHTNASKCTLIQLLGAFSVVPEARNFKMALNVAYTCISHYSLKIPSKILNKKKTDHIFHIWWDHFVLSCSVSSFVSKNSIVRLLILAFVSTESTRPYP